MNALRGITRCLMLAVVAGGFSLAPAEVAASSPAVVCEPGIYHIYNQSGQFVGVVWVRKDCSQEIIWA